jgi:broad specificity phosphatase PhoE
MHPSPAGEAYKNTVSGKAADDPKYDRLTEQGRQQAMSAGTRLQSARLRAVVTAPEARTRDTALAITLRSMLPTASVDGALTSKAFEGESAEQRAARGSAAVRRFLASTHGDVAVVSHGHVIHMMATTLTGGALTRDVIKNELVNGGIIKLSVTGAGTSSERWTKLASDALVRDD